MADYQGKYTGAQVDALLGKAENIGNLTNLETTTKVSIVAAINELHSDIGTAEEELSNING